MKQRSHLVMLPSPGMGHFIPMLEFAKRLNLQHKLSTTLIIPHSGPSPSEQNTFLETLPKEINHILLLPPKDDVFEADFTIEMLIASIIPRSLPSIRNAIKSLMESANLVALVVDLLGTSAFDVATEFNIPPYIFFPSSAIALSLFLYLPKLDTMVSCEYRDLSEPVQIPGCSNIPLRAEDNPFQERKSMGYKWFLNNVKRYKMAEGIIINSFEGMEAGVIKALQQQVVLKNPPIYPVGPLVQTQNSIPTTSLKVKGSSSAAAEAARILKWLDGQPPASILFVCFGSLGSLSHAQIHELALGLEMSEKGFLWVIRSSNNNNNNNNAETDDDRRPPLPEGFVERTKGRGLLVSNWAPQAQVLSHGSTGGFLTHCGWNSVLESVVNGMPMIAWPLFAEQRMNAAMLCEDLKIALKPPSNKGNDGLVGRDVIASSVKNLMEGEEGKQLRRRTKDLMDAAVKVCFWCISVVHV
ncbi:hypothetical protein ACH5RR_024172 [Cinchona calisaya]|uniref:Glycosyltransferase n=1 Tax=Cinchona calisaya TaxID=153742 RepID=A0ABD2ZG33_9GENT